MNIEVSAAPRGLEDRAGIHAALADPLRVAMVDALGVGDRTPGELARALGIGSNLLAHHLHVLEKRGLVERRRSIGDGRRAYVRLVPDRLAALAVHASFSVSRVLFVCTRNSARSQLAAATWNREPRAVHAESAGTHPAGRVHPGAVRAGRRHSLDLSGATPRTLPRPDARTLLVTVCDQAREELRDRVDVHWSVPDPVAAGTRDAFDAAADEIAARVASLDRLIRS